MKYDDVDWCSRCCCSRKTKKVGSYYLNNGDIIFSMVKKWGDNRKILDVQVVNSFNHSLKKRHLSHLVKYQHVHE